MNWIEAIEKYGFFILLLPMLAFFVIGTVKEWWIYAPAFRRAMEEAAANQERVYQEMVYWRNRALETVGLAEKVVGTVEEATDRGVSLKERKSDRRP